MDDGGGYEGVDPAGSEGEDQFDASPGYDTDGDHDLSAYGHDQVDDDLDTSADPAFDGMHCGAEPGTTSSAPYAGSVSPSAGTVAPDSHSEPHPVLGTNDIDGDPTHATYSGVIDPPRTMVSLGGNSPLYDGTGRSMVGSPAPSGSSGTVVGGTQPPPVTTGRDDPTHVTLSYVPAQVPHAPPTHDEALDPTTSAGWQHTAQMQEIGQGLQDVNTRAAGNIPGSDLLR